MRVFPSIAIFWLTVALAAPLAAQQETDVKLPPKENFHLFLLAGQSNMAGRGKVADEDREVHPRVLAWTKDGTWQPAVDPLHWDKSVAGVGLGKSFALALAAENEDVTIGLIPTACGGSPISSWQPLGYHAQTKSHPYDDALKRAQQAMQDGTLKGILWHQGESDCKPKLAQEHQARLETLITRFREDLRADSLPFIIGQLGQFSERPWHDERKAVNAAHMAVANDDALVGFVSSAGLTCKSDKVHFDAKSLREFGGRYAKVYAATLTAVP